MLKPDLQEEWGNYYDINLYCTDGIAKVIARELEIATDGHIQGGHKEHIFEIPLDRKHEAMLTAFFEADGSPLTRPWYDSEDVANEWQDYDTWGYVEDCVQPLIDAGSKANDPLAVSLAYWFESLPTYTLFDWRDKAMVKERYANA